MQKIISDCGLLSRREAERLIAEGRVTVNGKAAVLGQKADLSADHIEIDGNPLVRNDKRVYIMLNKPRGYVTTMKDEKGRKTVFDLVKDCGARVYPVGRLDMDSEGLLIMTNDGELANMLTHPSFHVPKRYLARVKIKEKGKDVRLASELLGKEMYLDGTKLMPAEVNILHSGKDTALVSVIIYEGKNRQIRRMCQTAGLDVLRLKRISQGKLKLGGLKTGMWRYLSKQETDDLRSMIKARVKTDDILSAREKHKDA